MVVPIAMWNVTAQPPLGNPFCPHHSQRTSSAPGRGTSKVCVGNPDQPLKGISNQQSRARSVRSQLSPHEEGLGEPQMLDPLMARRSPEARRITNRDYTRRA